VWSARTSAAPSASRSIFMPTRWHYALSKLLRRPIKFVADRVESFNTDIHARDHRCKGKIGSSGRNHHRVRDRRSDRHRPYSMLPRTSAIEANQSSISSAAIRDQELSRPRPGGVPEQNVMCQYRAVGHPIACSVTEGLATWRR